MRQLTLIRCLREALICTLLSTPIPGASNLLLAQSDPAQSTASTTPPYGN